MKKITAFLLMLSMCFSMCSFGVCAQDDYNAEAMQTLEFLKAIYPELPFNDGDSVSRFEFIQAVVGLLGLDFGNSSETCFDDVAPDRAGSGVLNTALSMNLISYGTSFYPESPITYEQAVKITATACGYSPLAEAHGGYPYGYIAATTGTGLLDEVGTQMNSSDCAKLLYNMLTVDVYSQVSFGESPEYSVEKNTNLLGKYHSILSDEGIVTANEFTPLSYSGECASEGRIIIGSEEYETDLSLDYLGYNVTVYYRENGSKRKAVYIYPEENSELTLKSEYVISKDSDTLYYEDNGKEKKIYLSPTWKLILNGKAYLTEESESILTADTGYFTFVDNNSDGKYDVIKASVFEYMVVSYVDTTNEMIVDKNGITLDYSDSECHINCYTALEDGSFELSDINQLSEGTVLAVASAADRLYSDIYALSDIVNGTVTEYNSGDNTISVGGVSYKISPYLIENSLVPSPGDVVTLHLGMDSDAVECEYTSKASDYAYVVATMVKSGVDSKCRVRLFTENDEFLECDIAEKVKIDSVSGKTSQQTKDVLDSLIASGDTSRLIKFMLNDSGELGLVDTPVAASSASLMFEQSDRENNLTHYWGDLNTSITFKRTGFVPRFNITDATPCFVIPDSKEEIDADKFYVVSKSYFADDKSYAVAAYDLNSCATAGAILTRPGNDFSDSHGASMVEKIVKRIDSEGETRDVICLWQDGKFRRYDVDSTEAMSSIVATLKKGDIIRFSTDKKGYVNKITKDISLSDETFTDVTKTYTAYVKGRVYSRFGEYIEICSDSDIQPDIQFDKLVNYQLTDSVDVVFADVTRSQNADGSYTIEDVRLYHAPQTGIKTFMAHGDDASYVVLRTVSCNINSMFVINFDNKE